MKLVKIEDVRVGQIWQLHNLIGLVKEIDKGSNNLLKIVLFQLFYPTEGGIETESVHNIITKHKLIGKLGITHEIKDNRLVIISRDKFQIDDVVEFKDTTQREYVILREIQEIGQVFPNNGNFKCFHDIYGGRSLFDFEFKKIGIYGVTHEFVNDCEVKNANS